jgi:serine/threonine protein kinase
MSTVIFTNYVLVSCIIPVDTDLHAVIKNRLLQGIHMQYIMSQLCRVVKYIHSGNVIHRDLKPSNVLINSECFIKVRYNVFARSITRRLSVPIFQVQMHRALCICGPSCYAIINIQLLCRAIQL